MAVCLYVGVSACESACIDWFSVIALDRWSSARGASMHPGTSSLSHPSSLTVTQPYTHSHTHTLYTYTHTHSHLHTLHTGAYTHTCTFWYTKTHRRVSTKQSILPFICTKQSIYTHPITHTHTHTHTHRHTHSLSQNSQY